MLPPPPLAPGKIMVGSEVSKNQWSRRGGDSDTILSCGMVTWFTYSLLAEDRKIGKKIAPLVPAAVKVYRPGNGLIAGRFQSTLW